MEDDAFDFAPPQDDAEALPAPTSTFVTAPVRPAPPPPKPPQPASFRRSQATLAADIARAAARGRRVL